jgi:ATP-dependent DNA ligase
VTDEVSWSDQCERQDNGHTPLRALSPTVTRSLSDASGSTLEYMNAFPSTGSPARPPLPPLSPMLAVIGPLPQGQAEGEYAYEMLWNGSRTIVYLPADGTVRLLSATGQDVTDRYPELQTLAGALPAPEAVLDGEIVVLDSQGLPSVELLQQRMSLHHPSAVDHARDDLPIRMIIYDVLYLGEPTVQLPYTARRDLLDDLGLASPGITVPAAWPAMAAEALEASRREGYDGVVAKRLTSPYLPGRRTRDWIKVKHLRAAA